MIPFYIKVQKQAKVICDERNQNNSYFRGH